MSACSSSCSVARTVCAHARALSTSTRLASAHATRTKDRSTKSYVLLGASEAQKDTLGTTTIEFKTEKKGKRGGKERRKVKQWGDIQYRQLVGLLQVESSNAALLFERGLACLCRKLVQ